MRRRRLIPLVIAVAGAGCATAPTAPAESPAPEVAPEVEIREGAAPEAGRLPADTTPLHYALSLEIDPDADGFSGEVNIRTRVDAPRSVIWMHGRNLDVSSAEVHLGERVLPARFEGHEDEGGFARLVLDEEVSGELTIAIRYAAEFSAALDSIYKVHHGGANYVFSQMEPLAARSAFPGFDEPRFKTPFEVTLRIPKDHEAAANTPAVSSEVLGEHRVVRFAESPAIPTYLFALTVGPLDVVEGTIPATGERSEPLPFRGLAPRGRGEELAYAMEHTPAILQALEGYFGTAYPYAKLDIVAVPDFEAGAMENVGLVTFRDTALLVSEERTPTARLRYFAYIMAHELAHMWFGNLVTMQWWDDLWLNEAFASWMEHEAVARWREEYEADVELGRWVHSVMNEDSLDSARAIAQPIVSSHDIHNAFDGITYGKGAGVLGMFEAWLGPEVFQRGVQQYLAAHRFGNATRADLLSAMSEASGRDVTAAFNSFLTQPGLPFVQVSCEDGGDGPAHLQLRQSRYLPLGSAGDRDRRWQIPVCVRFGWGDRDATECTLMTEAEASIELTSTQCPQWLYPNAAGSGYYRWSVPSEQLAALRRVRGLSVRERIGFIDSLQAGFNSGEISGADTLDALLALAGDDHYAVATGALRFFGWVHDNIVPEADRAAFRSRLRRAYSSQYRRLGWAPRRGANEDDATRLRRGSVVSFLARTVRDPRVRRDGARLGQRVLNGDALDLDAVPADLLEAALVVAVQDGDAALWDKALGHFQNTQDGTVRRALLRALASSADPERARRALDLTLEEGTRVNEIFTPLMVQFRSPERREAAWEWLQEHFSALVEKLPPGYAGYLPTTMSGACDASSAEAVSAFFGGRVDELPGGPRNLAATVEEIGLCQARADAQREAIVNWLH